MANEEPQFEMGMEGMPDLLSSLLGQWTEPESEVIELLLLESLAPVVEPEPVCVLNIDELLDAWDEEKQEIVVAPEPEPESEPEPASLLNIEALLDAWDDDKQEIVTEPEPERELVKLARAIAEEIGRAHV